MPVLPTQSTYKPFAVNKMRVDWYLHAVEVVGSNPVVHTNNTEVNILKGGRNFKTLPIRHAAPRSDRPESGRVLHGRVLVDDAHD